MRSQALKIPVTNDVCIFCLTRIQFASVHALRRSQRRFVSSTRAFQRPPAIAVAQKEEDGTQDSDLARRSQPPRPFGGGWARTRPAAPSDLTPEEKALRNALQNNLTREPPQLEEKETTQEPRIRRHTARGRTLQAPPQVEENETTQGSRVLQHVGRGYSLQRPPPPESHTPRKPRFGGWAKSGITTELTSEEQALRQSFQREAAPEPRLPVHRISHSPHTSSVPGYPSRQELQARRDAPLEETARTFPIQTSGTQRQGTQENTNNEGLLGYRQTRDAQLNYHISQSTAKPKFRQGDWYCPSCAQHNPERDRKCPTCQTVKPFMANWQCQECGKTNPPKYHFCYSCQTPIASTTAQGPTDHVKHWKHVRRPGYDASPGHSPPEQSPTQERSADTRAIARASAIEREKMERMEKTKGGEFVGLGGQYETATSEAMKYSHWSLEPDGSEAQHVKPTTADAPDTSTTGSHLVNWRAQSATKPQVNGVQGITDKRSGQEVAGRLSEDRSKVAKFTGGWKRWEPPSAGSQPPLEESSERGHLGQADRPSQPSSFELAREQNARKPEFSALERERRTRHEPRGRDIARHSLYESTSMPHVRGGDRDKLRKSKKVVSTYDDADEDDEDRAARRMGRKEQRKKARAIQRATAPATPIYLPEFISVSNLAGILKVRVDDFIHKMKALGFEETNNDHVLDAETAGLVAAEFNFEPIVEQAENQDLLPRPPAEDTSVLPPRPPVVTIMGHVDHGKTTLLDYLRKSSVAASEHGGITQHIGAFSVPMPGGRLVTFLDTPGHEAFLSMRQRGANVTDIVILVVAADDSVKPQTIEAIRHAQTAKVPMIVAVNKIDKEDSNVERVKQDLARYGVEIEDYGGDTQVVCVSGKTGQGMEELEDAAVALADILDMRSETDGQAEGWVLEATTKKAGRVATVLVRRGTLRPGDIIVAGTSWARVRSLRNEASVMLKSAGPGTPVEIDGWREQPAAGDEVLQAPDEQGAKAVIDYRLEAYERTRMATDMAAVNEARRLEQEKREEKREELERAAGLAETDRDAATPTEGQSTPSTPSFQEVFFIIKADVSGSVEAVADAVSALGNSEVRPHILRTGVGPVTEFDVDHAAVAKGSIISFNTTVDGSIQRMAEAKKVKILDQRIIYRLVDDVKAKLSEMLPAIVTQKVLGEAEIAQVFEINTKGRVTVPFAGCKVRNGVVGRNHKIRVLRGKEVVYDGTLSSLKNVKKDVTEMRKGSECGMGFENWTEFKLGDQVQSYETMSEKRTL
ncbi:hypothetical protein HO173_006210 [Letharia columbiana]|uniref:Translation initiation factor IF-2, mitochondrial n=1 Tax=Letharia columbiana TaxID=112416 RepID=A0A8H6FVF0_9LECA|nr:uncharacterized protein HO173_006210 [Letharia columbiana]KAF6235527.1 hypothetical protein HO173_006210 [Letharia columbiana]